MKDIMKMEEWEVTEYYHSLSEEEKKKFLKQLEA